MCHLTNTISIRADEGTTGVTIAGGGPSGAGTDHVLSDVAWEDCLTVLGRVDRDLDPLKVVGKEQTSSSCKSPASAVTDCLGRDLLVIKLEEIDGGYVRVIQVEGLLQGDDADVVVKVRGVPALMILHGLDGSGLVSTLKVPVVRSGNNRVQEGYLSLAAVGGSDNLVLVHHRASTNV